MAYNDYMYAVDRNDEYLAHYGIRGMKWGVHKAIESGNSRKLDRAYRKAAKKLAKLEKRAASGKKYAKRAAALGAGAAAAGGLALAGTQGVGNAITAAGGLGSRALSGAGNLASRVGGAMTRRGIRGGGRISALGRGMSAAAPGVALGAGAKGMAVKNWGAGNSLGKGLANAGKSAAYNTAHAFGKEGIKKYAELDRALINSGHKGIDRQIDKVGKISNNTFARAGAAALGAGLAGAAGYNAYRAATTKRAARKAAEWRNEMNKAFSGTKYANDGNGGGSARSSGKKRRRR